MTPAPMDQACSRPCSALARRCSGAFFNASSMATLGLGRIVALYHRSITSYQIHIFVFLFLKRQCGQTLGNAPWLSWGPGGHFAVCGLGRPQEAGIFSTAHSLCGATKDKTHLQVRLVGALIPKTTPDDQLFLDEGAKGAALPLNLAHSRSCGGSLWGPKITLRPSRRVRGGRGGRGCGEEGSLVVLQLRVLLYSIYYVGRLR